MVPPFPKGFDMTNEKNPKQKLVACEVLRDYWTDKGERVRKGTGVEVTAEEAMTGLENNTLKRVK